jgi:hypothetical protein
MSHGRMTIVGGRALALVAALTAGMIALPARADHSPSHAQPTSTPQRVLLVFNAPPPSDPSDACAGGSNWRHNQPGDHDELTACTFDAAGNPVATDATDHSLRWSSGDGQNDTPDAVRFNPTPPPEETTGATATATAGIDAVTPGGTHVTVSLVDGNGVTVDWYSVEKQIAGGGCGPPPGSSPGRSASRAPQTSCRDVPTVLTARPRRSFIRGRAKTESECRANRQVTVFLRRRGTDDVVGVDTTGDGGRWRVRTGKPESRYYARVSAVQATDVESGGTINCLPDQSNDVPRR